MSRQKVSSIFAQLLTVDFPTNKFVNRIYVIRRSFAMQIVNSIFSRNTSIPISLLCDDAADSASRIFILIPAPNTNGATMQSAFEKYSCTSSTTRNDDIIRCFFS